MNTMISAFLIMILWLYPSLSRSEVNTRLLSLRFPAETLINDWNSKKTVNGYTYDVVLYEVPLNILVLSQQILKQLPDKPSLQAMPDGLMISGFLSRQHWLIRLSKLTQTRTNVYISMLDWSRRQSLSLAWMPSIAQQIFSSSSSSTYENEESYVYQARLALSDFQSIIYKSLRAKFWALKQGSVLSRQQVWTKGKDQISLFFSRDSLLSQVFVLYQKGAL